MAVAIHLFGFIDSFTKYYKCICYERDFMTSLSEIIEAFKSTSGYLDVLLNVDNPY